MDIPFFFTTGVLQGDTLAPFLFIICLDYIHKTAKVHYIVRLTTDSKKIQTISSFTYNYIYYADDIAVTTNIMKDDNKLLHQIEETSDYISI